MNKLEQRIVDLKDTRQRIVDCKDYSDDLAGRTYKAQDLRNLDQEIADLEAGIVYPTMKIVKVNK